MGAGHDGAARELANRLGASGHPAEVRDFLDSGPLRIGPALRSGYEFELKHLPSAYDATYRLWYRAPWLCPLVAWLVTALTGRRVLRWVRASGADAVVSTYPLATLCLGRLRAKGRLAVPAVNFVTDFGVHPLWVHRGIDLHLAVHSGPARMASDRTGRRAVACGPVVSPDFEPGFLPERDPARARLGLQPDDRAVLVVAGSWGVGGVDTTWRALTADGRFTPVVVCGRDNGLHDKVQSLAAAYPGRSVVIGWTDEMASLMAACDALVENAGGLTSLEAMRAGLPVVSFEPIAGHGKENTAQMADAGVSRLARDPADLSAALDALTTMGPERTQQVAMAQAMFRGDAAALVRDAVVHPEPVPVARRPAAAAARAAVAIAALAGLGWAGLTSGVAMAAEAGAGVAHPAPGMSSVAYVGVRLDAAELNDPVVVTLMQQLDLTAVIDTATAMQDVGAVRHVAALGIDVENGGQGDWLGSTGHDADPALWTRARADARAGRFIGLLIGRSVPISIPGRRINAWDLIECRNAHTALVVPNHVLEAGRPDVQAGPIHLTARHIYLINGLGATPAELDTVLSDLSASLSTANLTAMPLATLK